MNDNNFIIKLTSFEVGFSPSAHLDSLTEFGGAGSASVMVNVDVLTPKILTQGSGLLTLTAGTQAGAITELVNFILDRPTADSITYGVSTTLLHQIAPTAVTNVGIWPHTITGSTSGSSCIEFQGALYYFFNKSSGADCGKYDFATTFDDDWISTVPTGKAALQSAPHPVAKKEDIMLFGNGRYVGTYISTTNTVAPTKLDFGAGTQVVDVAFHANQWWIAVNTGVSTGSNRGIGQIYLYDGAATTAILADEVAVGVQKIGFIIPINGIIYVAYQDLSGSYCVGYVSGRRVLPLCFFTGSLPTFAQKTLYKNFIIFVSGAYIYAFGAVTPDFSYAISQHADGGYATIGAIAAPFGTPMVASTETTSFKLAKFSGYDTVCSWKSLVIPITNGRLMGYIDSVVVKTKNLGANARCDLVLEYNQNQSTSRTWSQTCVFSSTNTVKVSWASGTFTGTDGTIYTISAGDTGNMLALNYVYFDTATPTVYLATTSLSTATGATKTIVANAQNGASAATFLLFNTDGGAKQIKTTNKRRHVFDKFSIPAGGIEDVRVALDWSLGNATNDCAIKNIIILGHYLEK